MSQAAPEPAPAPPPARPRRQPRSRSRPAAGFGAREVVLGWCLWLIGSWGLVLAHQGLAPAVAAGPVHRRMSLMALVGMTAVWPAVRLSQEARDAWGRPTGGGLPRREVLLDWFALNAVFQAVLWPMAFVSRWSARQALLLGATLAAWSLLAGLITAWGRSTASGGARAAAMAGCLAVLLLEPLALFGVAAATGAGWGGLPDLRLSPLQAVWAFSGPPARFAWADPAFAYRTAGVAAAAALGWLVFLLLGPRGFRGTR